MDTYKLDVEEQEILDSFERGEWQSIPTVQEEIGRYQTDAAAILARSKRISTDNRFAKTTNQERQR